MVKEMHIGRIGTKLQKVLAGLDDKIEQADDLIGAAQSILQDIAGDLKEKSPLASAAVQDIVFGLKGERDNIASILSRFEHDIYEENAESAIQESLVATADLDFSTYMAGCVLSDACHSLMQELKPDFADKTTADNIGKFLATEGIDYAHYVRMLEQEMKEVVDKTNNVWQGQCSVEELCTEFPDIDIPMQIALLSRGHECDLEQDLAVSKYMEEKGITSNSVPLCSDDAVLDACHAVFEEMDLTEVLADKGKFLEFSHGDDTVLVGGTTVEESENGDGLYIFFGEGSIEFVKDGRILFDSEYGEAGNVFRDASDDAKNYFIKVIPDAPINDVMREMNLIFVSMLK